MVRVFVPSKLYENVPSLPLSPPKTLPLTVNAPNEPDRVPPENKLYGPGVIPVRVITNLPVSVRAELKEIRPPAGPPVRSAVIVIDVGAKAPVPFNVAPLFNANTVLTAVAELFVNVAALATVILLLVLILPPTARMIDPALT